MEPCVYKWKFCPSSSLVLSKGPRKVHSKWNVQKHICMSSVHFPLASLTPQTCISGWCTHLGEAGKSRQEGECKSHRLFYYGWKQMRMKKNILPPASGLNHIYCLYSSLSAEEPERIGQLPEKIHTWGEWTAGFSLLRDQGTYWRMLVYKNY